VAAFLGHMTYDYNLLSVPETIVQNTLPKFGNSFIVFSILNVVIASNFGILSLCPTYLLWKSGHLSWYIRIFHLEYIYLFMYFICL
jgi:hypothetical protein